MPRRVCYKAHCDGTWVWVTPDGMKGLADFTLVMQDIARISINAWSLFNFPPTYASVSFETVDSPVRQTNKETGEVESEVHITAQVVVDQSGHLLPDSPYWPLRMENLGVDATLRSQVHAAVATPPH